jgi:hypothetical protein
MASPQEEHPCHQLSLESNGCFSSRIQELHRISPCIYLYLYLGTYLGTFDLQDYTLLFLTPQDMDSKSLALLKQNQSVCRVEQVTVETTVCEWHTDCVGVEAEFCDMVTVKVDVHKLSTTVGPIKSINKKMAQTNCKKNSLKPSTHCSVRLSLLSLTEAHSCLIVRSESKHYG